MATAFHTASAAQAPVTFGEVLKFIETGFRNINHPEFSGDDLEDIAGALAEFHRARCLPSPSEGAAS